MLQERRLSKEAIQAANYLGGLSLKDKLQHEQVATYKAYFGPRQIKSSGRVSAPRHSSSPTPSIPVPPPSPSPPPLTPALGPPPPPPPPLAPVDQRVVVLWNTRLRQHRAGQQARLSLAHGVATPSPRPLSSPTAASSTGGWSFLFTTRAPLTRIKVLYPPNCGSTVLVYISLRKVILKNTRLPTPQALIWH